MNPLTATVSDFDDRLLINACHPDIRSRLLYSDKFKELFDLDLKYHWRFGGLDVVVLAYHLGTPDDMSMKAWIKRKYGDEALEFVEMLTKIDTQPRNVAAAFYPKANVLEQPGDAKGYKKCKYRFISSDPFGKVIELDAWTRPGTGLYVCRQDSSRNYWISVYNGLVIPGRMPCYSTLKKAKVYTSILARCLSWRYIGVSLTKEQSDAVRRGIQSILCDIDGVDYVEE